MYLLLIVAVTGLKTLLCKGIALGLFLLAFWLKGRQFQFHSEKWEQFFRSLPAKKAWRCAAAIYLTAAAVSSAVSGFLLKWAGCRHSFGTAVLIFLGGLTATACKYRKRKGELLKRYQEIPRTIRERKERERRENAGTGSF